MTEIFQWQQQLRTCATDCVANVRSAPCNPARPPRSLADPVALQCHERTSSPSETDMELKGVSVLLEVRARPMARCRAHTRLA